MHVDRVMTALKVSTQRLCRTETKQGELMRLWVLVTKFMAEFCNPIMHLNVKKRVTSVKNPFRGVF